MAPFPDDLPPAGLDAVPKLLIYFGILYILTTAITAWFITRRRSFPKPVERPAEPVETTPSQTTEPRTTQIVGISQALSFEDTKDKLSSMKIEVKGAEAALEKLKELQNNDELSSEAYMKLSSRYNDLVNKIKQDMNQMLQSDIESSAGEIDTGITDDEMESIEADLEKQLLDLEDDDAFLRKRPKKNLDEILTDPSKDKTQPAASTPKTPVTRPAPKASVPATPASAPPKAKQETQATKEKKRVPMPPPPKKEGSAASAPPAATSSSSTRSSATPPKPSGEKDKSSMVPPPPKKAGAPPPPSSSSTPPKATSPASSGSNQPLSAAQPMKVESEEDDGMFAKSTSIAALRMDMLRELARLKKLIPEDQEKDQ